MHNTCEVLKSCICWGVTYVSLQANKLYNFKIVFSVLRFLAGFSLQPAVVMQTDVHHGCISSLGCVCIALQGLQHLEQQASCGNKETEF